MDIKTKASPHILVADDLASSRFLVKNTLRQHGLLNVEEVCDGLAVINKLKVTRYDLLICDLVMPRLDGFTLLKSLRESAEFKELPVILVTGESEREYIVKAVQLGISGYVCKPFTPGCLINVVKKALGGVDNLDLEI